MGGSRSPKQKDDDFRSFLQSFVDKNRKIQERRQLAARQPVKKSRRIFLMKQIAQHLSHRRVGLLIAYIDAPRF